MLIAIYIRRKTSRHINHFSNYFIEQKQKGMKTLYICTDVQDRTVQTSHLKNTEKERQAVLYPQHHIIK